MRRIRIAQVLNRVDSGGIETVVLNYYRCIDKSKFQFDFFFDEGSSVPFREEMSRLGASLIPIPPYTKQAVYQKVLEKALREGQYDIVHVHMNTMSVFALAAAKRAGIPVRICHNHSTGSWHEGKRTLLKVLLRPWNRLPATAWFACGKQAGEWMFGHKAVEKGKVFFLPNAIDTRKYAYDAKARDTVRSILGIAEDAYVVGHVGRFMKQKNHTYLLSVFRKLQEIREDAILLLIGEGELEEEIRLMSEKIGLGDRVIFAGVRSDLPRVYSAMDVFCLPSLYEGFPVVLLEAQANGLPVVCSDKISEEVCLTGLVKRLPLEYVEIWPAAMLEKERSMTILPDEYEIRNAVKLLEEKYIQLIIGNCSVTL